MTAHEVVGPFRDSSDAVADYQAVCDRLGGLLTALREQTDGGDATAWQQAVDLHEQAGRLVRERLAGRLAAWERVHTSVRRLADLGPPSELIDRAPAEAAAAVPLARVVLSQVEDGHLVASSVHIDDDREQAAATLAILRQEPVVLDYPLIESDAFRRRRALFVEDADRDPRGRSANADVVGWGAYVTAPVVLEGRVVAFFHGDRAAADPPLGPWDRDTLELFAQGFAQCFERAVLRRRLRTQREEMRRVASWADARTSDLSDRAISLSVDRDRAGDAGAASGSPVASPGIQELLTRREIEVLERMVAGGTNADIARALVISEGTVKFHVKNILRKMHAGNRAQATSRYLRMKLGPPGSEDDTSG
jgi:LuxR family transcriptional regulator, regulator of acetate metabolism